MRVTSDGISGQKWPPTILPGGSLTFTLARPFQRRNTFTLTIHLHLQYIYIYNTLVLTLFMDRSGSEDKFPHSIQIIVILIDGKVSNNLPLDFWRKNIETALNLCHQSSEKWHFWSVSVKW